MTFESAGLLIVAIYIWLPPASYVVFLTTLVLPYYPRATRCGGDIVTLPWFRQCVRPSVRASRLILVNAIATKL